MCAKQGRGAGSLLYLHLVIIPTSAVNRLIPTRAFSWLEAPTSASTFKTLLRCYAKQALTPR